MSDQSEYQLEDSLMTQIEDLGYERITIPNEAALIANLKKQIVRANGLSQPLSTDEWKQVISHLESGTSFERAKKLRNKFNVRFDDGSSRHIQFFWPNADDNIWQLSNQIMVDHSSQNGRTSRFDVTILVNGLPLVQVELKRRGGIEIAEAFHQTMRYSKDAYKAGHGLFEFIQLFVISNGANTRYYAKGTQHFNFTFPWADIDNKPINEVVDFTKVFLQRSHLNEMIAQFIVLYESSKTMMVLRPYQVHATKRLIDRATNSNKNGYIWHTTGSGKTLTSFKASQIIMQLPDVEKVVFVVDRNDLDTQTANEFNAYKDGSVDSTTNTKNLVKQLGETHDKLIVTTIQKLNRAIKSERHQEKISYLQDKKVVFIFDECHRSQFGETHRNIKRFFQNAQMFGFTGTPILIENAHNKAGLKLTTAHLFDECLHRYTIVDAIRDKNVLPFQIDYVGKFTKKDKTTKEEVTAIDTQEMYNNPERIEDIAKYIIDRHNIKTKRREFNALFCVSSVDMLTQYYDAFERIQVQKQADDPTFKPLKIATIFSYAANEATDASFAQNGLIEESSFDTPTQIDESSRDKLDRYIGQYNETFETNFDSGQGYYPYYRDIATKVKQQKIDLLIVVNMFLTGFDAKTLNTLYVDKNLKYHGLVQAFSRTNRIYNDKKPFGNIVCFRNLKQATDDALALFANKEAKDIAVIPSMQTLEKEYNQAAKKLLDLCPDYKSVDDLETEDDQLEFIKAFREVMRYNEQLNTFVDYSQASTDLGKEDFANFASKYIDLYRQIRIQNSGSDDKTSVLEDIDFQIEMLHSDRINVSYIIELLRQANKKKDAGDDKDAARYQAQVHDLLMNEPTFRDKQELIQKFINEQMPKMPDGQTVEAAFANFWDVEKEAAYQDFCKESNLKTDVMQDILKTYETNKRLPNRNEIQALPNYKVKLFERNDLHNRLINKTRQFIQKFYTEL